MADEMVHIDAGFVREWSRRYPLATRETRLFDEIGPAASERGYLTSTEFREIGEWKSSRPRKRLASNADADVEDVTRIAFAAPDRLKHKLLLMLNGVRTPMASAILAVWNPHRFTVTDFRAMETLRAAGEVGGTDPRYMEYLAVCRAIAHRNQVDLRTLDRALWTWSKEQGRAPEPDDDGPDADTRAAADDIGS